MKTVYILGQGQLGQMLRQAGEPLGIKVYPLCLEIDESREKRAPPDIITAEIEHWPDNVFVRQWAQHPLLINRDTFPLLADRFTQKQLLDELSLPTAPWQLLTKAELWPKVFSSFDSLAVVKRRKGGYDGKGQWCLRPGEEHSLPSDLYGACIVEKGIRFSYEISLIGARNHRGQSVFYPITYNWHEAGILRASVAFPTKQQRLQAPAESMLSRIMNKLDYIGVMAMECFVVGNDLLINELAPRVHNSGHWTQNGASISQFELHLRAILDLPLPLPVVSSPSVMLNLIGTHLNPSWLSLPLIHVHWYGKEVRAGRKLGHLNLSDPSINRLIETLDALAPLLPQSDQVGLLKAKEKLENTPKNFTDL
ncbi:5-(carboxyamino)imidazole ribonucleotide synthase [Candidatus Williamhamiltonella defendens]|uniref:N5-carboxyaminoimidazole ribonucleotide synthase n=1 Tax=Candidatus Hamiltonella defensa (Bemisia tabaci) TaxID=672795 RepID=A0A249DZB0_9ENTR|nr:5-(carboxyamino)imidazole ribonucleotide synthase [Candidatus Hamiltonella defensa]ASX26761.1 5-(carboxyamino)imidazole ribonucleotide synthase [Candidatus Hamiltonella defensa (Bemisia tabaci)]